MDPTILVQRSPEWLQARCGSLGSSKASAATATLKRGGGATKEADDLAWEIAAERLTGQPARRVNALQWGVDHEEEARDAYGFMTNAPLNQVGLVPHPTIIGAHASPDALIGDDGVLELKCPTSGVHLKWRSMGVVPEEHLEQIWMALACTERQWCDFMSYDPRFLEPRLQTFVVRVERDASIIKAFEERVRKFIKTVDQRVAAA